MMLVRRFLKDASWFVWTVLSSRLVVFPVLVITAASTATIQGELRISAFGAFGSVVSYVIAALMVRHHEHRFDDYVVIKQVRHISIRNFGNNFTYRYTMRFRPRKRVQDIRFPVKWSGSGKFFEDVSLLSEGHVLKVVKICMGGGSGGVNKAMAECVAHFDEPLPAYRACEVSLEVRMGREAMDGEMYIAHESGRFAYGLFAVLEWVVDWDDTVVPKEGHVVARKHRHRPTFESSGIVRRSLARWAYVALKTPERREIRWKILADRAPRYYRLDYPCFILEPESRRCVFRHGGGEGEANAHPMTTQPSQGPLDAVAQTADSVAMLNKENLG